MEKEEAAGTCLPGKQSLISPRDRRLKCSIFIKITFSIKQKKLLIFRSIIRTPFRIHQANGVSHN